MNSIPSSLLCNSLCLQPPQPASYEVLEHKDGSEELYINPLQE